MRRLGLVVAAVLAAAGLTSVPAAATVPTLNWTDCGDGFQCATLDVPLDYRDPGGPRQDIAVIRLPAADPAQRIGTLLLQPGGPGGSGLAYVRANARTGFAALSTRFDLVGLDPRGVGGSGQLSCWTKQQYLDELGLARVHAGPGAFERAVASGLRFDQACVDSAADLLPHLGTANLARDIDQFRRALGEQRLTYFGTSYGSYVGTVYANLFPSRLRGAVLDGGYNPNAYANQPYLHDLRQYVAADAALARFLRWCGENPAVCPLGAGDAAGAFDRMVHRLDQQPIIAHASDGTTVTVNGTFLLYQTLLALNSGRAFWPTFGFLLALADAGAGPLVSGELPPTLIPLLTVNTAVECADRLFPTDQRVLRAALAAESLAGQRFGAAMAYGPPAYDQAHATACVPWPAPRKSRYAGPFTAAGAPPILVVGTTGDPDTPYQDAVTLARTLASGRLITLAGEGHTAYGRSACVTAAVTAYLTDLTLPPAGTVCDDEAGA